MSYFFVSPSLWRCSICSWDRYGFCLVTGLLMSFLAPTTSHFSPQISCGTVVLTRQSNSLVSQTAILSHSRFCKSWVFGHYEHVQGVNAWNVSERDYQKAFLSILKSAQEPWHSASRLVWWEHSWRADLQHLKWPILEWIKDGVNQSLSESSTYSILLVDIEKAIRMRIWSI